MTVKKDNYPLETNTCDCYNLYVIANNNEPISNCRASFKGFWYEKNIIQFKEGTNGLLHNNTTNDT